MTDEERERKKKEKKKQDALEAFIMDLIERCAKAAIEEAMNELFEEFGFE